jgi:flavin reductase (DIM6/NTAB) family NADH-FMN oxidoreductase RutF
MPIDKHEFREVLRHWASGITVVTTRHEGGIHGMTASSFCSLSIDPPLVLVSVNKRNRTHELIPRHGAFGVHFLAEGQESLSDRCAGFFGEEGNLLEGIPHRTEVTGAPILDHCLAWLDCRLWAAYDGGDHTIYLGLLEAAGASDRRPLVWFNRHYRCLAPD